MLPELLAQIPTEEPIGLVTADGAYDTRPCHAAIAARQASAVIPTRRNGRRRTGNHPRRPGPQRAPRERHGAWVGPSGARGAAITDEVA